MPKRLMPTMSIDYFRQLIPTCSTDGITKRGNPYAFHDGYCFVGLTNGKVCLIDPEDLELVSNHRWNAYKDKNTFYAASCPAKGTKLKMHRIICPGMKMIDHKNRNGLDNRKDNLVETNHSENGLNRNKQRNNTSGYPHVVKRGNRWRGQTKINGRYVNVGSFALPEEASAAVDAYLAGYKFGYEAAKDEERMAEMNAELAKAEIVATFKRGSHD